MANAKQKAALKKKAARESKAWTGASSGSKTVGARSVKTRQKKVVAPRANRRPKAK